MSVVTTAIEEKLKQQEILQKYKKMLPLSYMDMAVLSGTSEGTIKGILKGASQNSIALNYIKGEFEKDADYLKKALKGYKGGIYCIDARKVSEEALGRYFPNTPMLAAIVKVANIMDEKDFLNDMKGSFKHKFAKKPEVIEGNMKALEMALNEVKKIN